MGDQMMELFFGCEIAQHYMHLFVKNEGNSRFHVLEDLDFHIFTIRIYNS